MIIHEEQYLEDLLDEISVNCYNDDNVTNAIYDYLNDNMEFPFEAIYKSKNGEKSKVMVHYLDDFEGESNFKCYVESDEHEAFVSLSNIKPKLKNSYNAQLIDLFKYWRKTL